MNEQPKTRRVKVAYIEEREILFMAREHAISDQYVCVKTLDLPKDAYVRSVHHDYVRGAFGFVIESQEFDEVAPGEIMPSLMVTQKVVRRRLMRKNNAAGR